MLIHYPRVSKRPAPTLVGLPHGETSWQWFTAIEAGSAWKVNFSLNLHSTTHLKWNTIRVILTLFTGSRSTIYKRYGQT